MVVADSQDVVTFDATFVVTFAVDFVTYTNTSADLDCFLNSIVQRVPPNSSLASSNWI